jgi:hypothetical protein
MGAAVAKHAEARFVVVTDIKRSSIVRWNSNDSAMLCRTATLMTRRCRHVVESSFLPAQARQGLFAELSQEFFHRW